MYVLYDEFCDYQTLNDSEIGDGAWKAAKVLEYIDSDGNEVFHYRAHVLWWFIGQMQQSEYKTTNNPRQHVNHTSFKSSKCVMSISLCP